jgi:mono/diheme cytochrome c family protein
LFWIIKNGIKMSAMASYGKVHNDDEIWNVVAFVQRIPTKAGRVRAVRKRNPMSVRPA